MPLITVVVTIIVIGVLLFLVEKFLGPYMSPPMLFLLRAVVIIAVIFWLLVISGLLSGIATVPFPHR